jgi:hypothetical protein
VVEAAKPIVVPVVLVMTALSAGLAAAKLNDQQARDVEKGLRISAAVASEHVAANEPLNVTVVLRNVSEGPLAVLSHIETHETQLDWYRFRLEYLEPDGKGRCDPAHARRASRDIGIVDDRDKSIPIVRTLAPGGSITHTVDLQAWAARRINGAARIPPGLYQVSVLYTVTANDWGFLGGKEQIWRGTVESPRVPVVVTGAAPRDRCGPNPG